MSDPRDQCVTCRFYKGSAFSGECRRHAPIAVHDPNKNAGVYPMAFVPRFPAVESSDWCGDYEQ